MPRAGLDTNSVLQAAVELADREGFDAVALGTLARKLGIRTPSLYNHVDGLQGLRTKLTVHGLNQLRDVLMNAAVGKSKDEAVRAIAAAYVKFSRQHPGLYEATQRNPHEEDTEVRQAAEGVVHLVIQVFQAYGMKEDKAIHTIRGFRSLLHGFASIEQQGGFGMPLDLDESLNRLVDIFLAGIHSLYKIGGS